MDYLLKKELYKKSFPVIRKKLWLSSKKTSNLGKKPKTYIVTYAEFEHGDEKNSYSKFNKNDVLLFCGAIKIHHMKNWNYIETGRIFEFENKKIDLLNCYFSSENLKLFFHSNVVEIHIFSGKIDMKTVLDLAPNLQVLHLCYWPPENWEHVLFKSNLKLNYLHENQNKIIDIKVLHDFLKRQLPGFEWVIFDGESIERNLWKYFNECDLKKHNAPHIEVEEIKYCCK